VITADDRLLADLSPDILGTRQHRIFTKFKLPRCQRLAGTVAVLTAGEAAANYWHWTYDALPKLHLLARAGFPPEKVDWYLINHTNQPYQLETLMALGLRPEQILQVDARTHIEAERLLVCSPRHSQLQVAGWACAFLRGMLPEENNAHGTRRLYLSRARANFRRLRNEDETFALLREHGFESITCEGMSVREQQQLFREAEAVVGVHGAAFSNLVYCQPGTRVIEIFSPDYVDLSMWAHISHGRLRHAILLGQGVVPPRGIDPVLRTADITVEGAQLRQMLDLLGLAAPQPKSFSLS
jgi:capsular polysaccharide biosynthesis protein